MRDLIGTANQTLSSIVPLLVTVALIVFIWGLIQSLTKVGDAEHRGQSMYLLFWGITALFVMSSVWGLVALFQNTLGVNPNEEPRVPRAPDISNYGR